MSCRRCERLRVVNVALVFLACLAADGASAAEGGLRAVSPADGAEVPLLNEAQKAFLDMPLEISRVKFDEPVFRTNLVRSCGHFPLNVVLAWTNDTSAPCEVSVASLPDGRPVRPMRVDAFSATCGNLEVGRTYEWVVTCGGEAVTNRFTTENRAPRLIRDPNVPNVRDVGGWTGLGGRRIRQGRIFRSAGLNDNASEAYTTREEVLAADTDGSVARREAELLAEEKRLKRKNASLPVVEVALSGPWTCERADGRVESIEPDERHGVWISGAQSEKAVLKKTFQAEADGYAVFGCGGDWYWKMAVNGVVEIDRMKGNNRDTVSADNFIVVCPVRKGENTIETKLTAGSAGFVFYCTALTEKPARAASLRVKSAARLRAAIFRQPKGFVTGRSRITGENRRMWLSDFGLKSDIDLRSDRECYGMTGSPLGPSVAWFHYSGKCYEPFVNTQGGRESFARVFRVMLEEKNYPVDFHCIAGQDRTGSVSFVLLALLGADDTALYHDWAVTGFFNPESNWFNYKKRFCAMCREFERFGGADMRLNAEAYVKKCGFTDDDIARFRALMLED